MGNELPEPDGNDQKPAKRLDVGTVYKTSAGTWRVIRREGEILIAESLGIKDSFEVFRVGLSRPYMGKGGGNERPPLDEEWGSNGFSCQGMDRAEFRFNWLMKQKAGNQEE
jgi:hypothetical protein